MHFYFFTKTDPYGQPLPYPPSGGFPQPPPYGQHGGYGQPGAGAGYQQPPYPPGGILPIHGGGNEAPTIGFINPGYPAQPHPEGGYKPPQQPYGPGQGSGFVPLVQPQGPHFHNVPPAPQQTGSGGFGAEDQDVKGFDFSDESIRKGFIRKVYSILTVSFILEMGMTHVLIKIFKI